MLFQEIIMMEIRLQGAVCACLLLLVASIEANAAIVYEINRTIENGTITGFVETDATLGVLGSANITDWSLSLNAPNLQGGPTVEIAAATGILQFKGTALSASPTALTFDFSLPGNSNSIIFWGSGFAHAWGISECFSGTNLECILRDDTIANSDAVSAARTSAIDIGAASVVPVPAAVWFLGSGLVGLVGIRRRHSR